MRKATLALAATLTATMALAHTDVKNAAVLARMDAMKGIAQNLKVLGDMAKGERAFDAAEAGAAKAAMAAHVDEVPALFAAPETDPKSEALPAIWDNMADFEAKTADMARAVAALETGSAEAIGAGLRDVGATCGACHKLYRQE